MEADFLEASERRLTQVAESISGLQIPTEWFDEQGFISLRLQQYQNDPIFARWGVWSIALRATDAMVGTIGFHSPPGPDYLKSLAPGGIEFGYTIFPAHRRQGYAREAIQALVSWAAQEQDVPSFVLSIEPGNAASLALAQELGFEKVGEHIDPETGLEHIFRLEARALVRVVEAGDPARPSPIEQIPNFRRANDRLVTGGQPTEGQLRRIASEGFRAIINLGLDHDPRYSLPNEATLARSLGLEYVHIPVRFESPTREDLQLFFAAMDRLSSTRVFAHCAMNYRVSAFLGLYRVLRLRWSPPAAFALMRGIWEPNPTWAAFIEDQLQRTEPPDQPPAPAPLPDVPHPRPRA
jgi:RimJ/RimL family protein N-acetyltransferase/protein tyrosine phosphatase (PTP) superfamily phosphohydrolase (DUF442 family)